MPSMRAILLTMLPKVALSRLCGMLTSIPLPRLLRAPLYRWFARRYGASLDDIDAELPSFRSLQQFFRRSLRPTARTVASSAIVWPCDGRVVTIGPVANGRIEQVKGNTYELADLLGDADFAAELQGGQQATIYLAPGDYHRVHAPFAALVERVQALPGTLFPVNPPAVRCIRNLFARNARHVFHCKLPDGTPAAVVMVGAYNVGGTRITKQSGAVRAGEELGQFGFGSTTVFLIGKGGPTIDALPPEARVRMGEAASQ
jgi:phosphatidylserine decarboxylase